ncbi:MAG: glutamine-hydrolyzing carbamoyl-phosphate synthase small subunit [Bdellovibrionota bacterium]
MKKASLLLEDGSYFCVQAIGANTEAVGELVFNTAMTGYEEVLSDPSYLGQMVLFTTSYIGNTGITMEDLESSHMYAEAILCKNISVTPDNYRSKMSLEKFLQEKNKIALCGLDTRFLAQKIRDEGCLMAICSTLDHDKNSLMEKLTHASTIKTDNQTARYVFSKERVQNTGNKKYKIAVIDFGIKQGILNSLHATDCEVVLFPYTASVADIEAIQPDGLFFSNGPGDPKILAEQSNILNVIYELSQKYPTFGICLGHQLIALAYGENTVKLSHGHHAVNHPVKNLFPHGNEPQVYITSQNHNYVVELSHNIFEVTHVHLNDNTIAGIRHKHLPLFSVQFHPESNPGPHDARNLFEEFIAAIKLNKESVYAKKN